MVDARDQDFEGIRVLIGDWPIVVAEFPRSRVQDESIHALLAHLEAIMVEVRSRREKFFFVSDLTHMRELPTASQRKYTADWMARTFSLSKQSGVGAAHITPSAILRGIFTAVFWVTRSPHPSVFVATRQEAMLRGIESLEAAHQVLPPRLLALKGAGGAATSKFAG
jgi:hypothetical protein